MPLFLSLCPVDYRLCFATRQALCLWMCSMRMEEILVCSIRYSRKEEVKSMLNVPVFVEWNGAKAKSILSTLAHDISNKVNEVSSEQREKYHLAAVFANNFTNLMYGLADDYITQQKLDFKYLLPIIKETALRLEDGRPSEWQTGPAKRGDKKVIEKHLQLIDDEKVRKIYAQLSDYLMTKN